MSVEKPGRDARSGREAPSAQFPYGFGGGAIALRLAGGAGAPAFAFGFGEGVLVAAGVLGVGVGEAAFGAGDAAFGVGDAAFGAGSGSSTSSIGSPIVITEGIGAGSSGGASAGSSVDAADAVDALVVERLGSSVETAMTAAAVSATTTMPIAARPIRFARLSFGRTGTAAMLRIGPRPLATSSAV